MEALVRGAARRREAIDVLRLAAAVAGYAAGQVADGLSPVEAQCATWQAAEELTEIVMRLRRLGQVDPAGRREAGPGAGRGGCSEAGDR